MKKPLTHLILAGGIFHDFAASSEALATILAPLGIESRIEWDLEAGLAGLAESPVDLLSINALRWQMIGEKYDPYRDTEAFTPSQSARSALQLYLTTGGALLGLHTGQHLLFRLAGMAIVAGGAAGCGAQAGIQPPRPVTHCYRAKYGAEPPPTLSPFTTNSIAILSSIPLRPYWPPASVTQW